MEEKKSMGVFGSIRDGESNVLGQTKNIELNIVSEEVPDTIYNLLFKQDDGENR